MRGSYIADRVTTISHTWPSNFFKHRKSVIVSLHVTLLHRLSNLRIVCQIKIQKSILRFLPKTIFVTRAYHF